jgi:hypothetical protein
VYIYIFLIPIIMFFENEFQNVIDSLIHLLFGFALVLFATPESQLSVGVDADAREWAMQG